MPSDNDWKEHKDVYNNFATPLMGSYLNLPYTSTEIFCPSCGNTDKTEVRHEISRSTMALNVLYWTLFYCLCCRCCFDMDNISTKHDINHYCKHCQCFLGRVKRRMPLKYEKGKPITNRYAYDEYTMS